MSNSQVQKPTEEPIRVKMPTRLLWALVNDPLLAEMSRIRISNVNKYKWLTRERAEKNKDKDRAVLVTKKPVYLFCHENGLPEEFDLDYPEVDLHTLFLHDHCYGGGDEYAKCLKFANHSWLVKAKKQAHDIVDRLHKNDLYFGSCRLDLFFVPANPEDPILLDFGLPEWTGKKYSLSRDPARGYSLSRDGAPFTLDQIKSSNDSCVASYLPFYKDVGDDKYFNFKVAVEHEEQGQLQDWVIRLALHLRIRNLEKLWEDKFDRMAWRVTISSEPGPSADDLFNLALFY